MQMHKTTTTFAQKHQIPLWRDEHGLYYVAGPHPAGELWVSYDTTARSGIGLMRRYLYACACRANQPRVGDLVDVRGVTCTITRVHTLGTIDVEAPDGRCYRLTGLLFYDRTPALIGRIEPMQRTGETA